MRNPCTTMKRESPCTAMKTQHDQINKTVIFKGKKKKPSTQSWEKWEMATECKILDKMRNIEIVGGGNFTLSLSPRGPLPVTFLWCFGYVRHPISICCMISLIRLTFFNCYSQASILEKKFHFSFINNI